MNEILASLTLIRNLLNRYNKVLSYTADNELVDYVVIAGFEGKQYEQFKKGVDGFTDSMSVNRKKAEMSL